MYQLEEVNEYGYYEIRLEAVGGLGANLCGKLLGELGAKYLGLHAQSFSSYGSEKRGSPVQSHIRFSNKEILTNSIVKEPHILCLFHENIINDNSLSGINENTILIINTKLSPSDIFNKINKNVKEICCIDAVSLSNKVNARINIILLAAIVSLSKLCNIEDLISLVEETLGKKYPNSIKNNIIGLKTGFSNIKRGSFKSDKTNKNHNIKQYLWGYDNSPIGGINYVIGNTVANDLSSSREGFVPLFIEERCINCGLCDSTCPDYVFQFKEKDIMGKKTIVNLGLNYHHCKGCLRCVNICPTEALVTIEEEKIDVKKHTKKELDVLIENIKYNHIGSSSYITSESNDNIKNFKGGHF